MSHSHWGRDSGTNRSGIATEVTAEAAATDTDVVASIRSPSQQNTRLSSGRYARWRTRPTELGIPHRHHGRDEQLMQVLGVTNAETCRYTITPKLPASWQFSDVKPRFGRFRVERAEATGW
jgi:hypothetical protein